jgi:hypothetical protein
MQMRFRSLDVIVEIVAKELNFSDTGITSVSLKMTREQDGINNKIPKVT